jgi:hypothetical protein
MAKTIARAYHDTPPKKPKTARRSGVAKGEAK